VIAFIGSLLLSAPPAGEFSFGAAEIATLLGALAIAGEIILISRFARMLDAQGVTIIQLLVAGLSLSAIGLSGEPVPSLNWYWTVSALSLGSASAAIQFTMNWAHGRCLQRARR
jgi:hypothetical protein